MVDTRLVVHGLDLSYFTGKLEAYLRAKGIPYELREMTTRSFRECGKATGFLQMPQVELADGTWLTDTTLIIRYLEQHHPQPAISPTDPLVRFISLLTALLAIESVLRSR
jgi:glutathione S-transferase